MSVVFIIFFTTVKSYQIGCSIVAVILHYFFMASFMWMLMEGVVLYVIMVKVFIQGKERKYMIAFTVISYGMATHASNSHLFPG